jgi:aspartyl-tRNA(Asn)/glutamyl-tRNA(Gln) amidotransferase subunit A
MKEFSTLAEWSEALKSRAVSSVEAVDFFSHRIHTIDPKLNSFITDSCAEARELAANIDARRMAGEQLSDIAGIPFGIKDAIDSAGIRSTGAAKILDTFVPTFDSTVIKKLRDAGALVVGKQNCDSFGHGASNENSMYGPVRNPWDVERVAGGSSGGSAASVAANLNVFAIGEDTGGSIRAPASFCGVTGLKTSYGRTSRYGAMPMASSLDTVGPFAHSAEDVAMILQHIAGHDPLDATTAVADVPNYRAEITKPIAGMKIGVPKEYFTDELDAEIRARVEAAIAEYKKLGAEIVEISLPHTKYAIATYYVLVPCEDSSNLARLDGIRYGVRADAGDLVHTYSASRTQGFPDEVKRRIMIGTFALSHGNFDAFYMQAQKVRTLIKHDFDEAFKNVDVIMTPTTPEVAFKLGDKTTDPIKMYLSDAFVSPASLAGVCALSVPCGFVEGMPVGLQIIGPRLKEELPLRFGHQYQQITNWHTQHPAL